MLKTRLRRNAMAFFVCCFVILGLSPSAYAAENTYMSQMMQRAWSWYTLMRNQIAIPCLIVSFASCGFKIFSTIIMNKGEFARDAIMKQFWTSIVALAVLVMLPSIMNEAIALLQSTAWTPDAPSVKPTVAPTLPDPTTSANTITRR